MLQLFVLETPQYQKAATLVHFGTTAPFATMARLEFSRSCLQRDVAIVHKPFNQAWWLRVRGLSDGQIWWCHART